MNSKSHTTKITISEVKQTITIAKKVTLITGKSILEKSDTVKHF